MDECKLSAATLKSVNKEQDPEEEQIFRNLYMELEEIDRRVSRTRKKVVVRVPRAASRVAAVAPRSRTYVRRGSGSTSGADATCEEVLVPLSTTLVEAREPEYDDEGNSLSDGDYGEASDGESDRADDLCGSDYESDN